MRLEPFVVSLTQELHKDPGYGFPCQVTGHVSFHRGKLGVHDVLSEREQKEKRKKEVKPLPTLCEATLEFV